MTDKTKKETIVHKDFFDRPIPSGILVCFTKNDIMYLGRVGKMTAKMIRVHPLSGPTHLNKDGILVYSDNTVIADDSVATFYVLKNVS